MRISARSQGTSAKKRSFNAFSGANSNHVRAVLYLRHPTSTVMMLQRLHVYRAVWPLLIGVLAIAAWNGAIAWDFCSHESSSPKHCAGSATHSSEQTANVTGVARIASMQNTAEPCSHCLTHAPWSANSSRAIVNNNSSPGIVAAGAGGVVVESAPSNTPVQVYDHGPPGNGNPRYILNNTFRI